MKYINVSSRSILFIMFFFLIGCDATNKKEDYIENYELWLKGVKAQWANYKDEQWEEAEKQFDKYNNDQYDKFRDLLTEEQQKKVSMLAGQWYAIQVKRRANQIKIGLKNSLSTVEGLIEELKIEK